MIKCLIVCSNELLGVVVEDLCKTQADIKVVNVPLRANTNLIREIERHQPDVLIMDESVHLISPAKRLQSLIHFPNIRVIMLNMNVNVLQVYKKEEVQVTQISDLLSVVRDQDVNSYKQNSE